MGARGLLAKGFLLADAQRSLAGFQDGPPRVDLLIGLLHLEQERAPDAQALSKYCGC